MKKSYLLLFLLIISCLTSISCFGQQKDYWKILFPGYIADEYKASIDINGNLNLALNHEVVGQPNKFISINKKGYVIYNEDISDIALLNFCDSSGNKYFVSYYDSTLSVRKLDQQNNTIWNNDIVLQNAITVGNIGLDEYYFVSTSQYLFTSNGKLVIAGSFQSDTTGLSAFESISAIFLDVSSGALLDQYNHELSIYPITKIDLQEDSLGNINLLNYNSGDLFVELNKFSQTGIHLSNNEYLSNNITLGIYSIKVTPNFIYITFPDMSLGIKVLKLGKTLLDTIYYIDYPINEFGMGNYVDANDSAYYVSYFDNGNFTSTFKSFDFYGNPVCTNSSGNFPTIHGCNIGKTCYGFDTYVSVIDSTCSSDSVSRKFDQNTQELIYNYIDYSSNSNDFYSNNDIIYKASKNFNNIFGVVGFIDAQHNDYSGQLYFDENNNCILDTNERGIVNQLIKINPQGQLLFTGGNGFFENYLDSGSYNLIAKPFNATSTFCPATLPLHIADTSIFYTGNNIAILDQSGNLQDLSITINQSSCIPGHTTSLFIDVRNLEPLPASGNVKLSMNPNIFTMGYASPGADSTSGNDYFWHVDNVDILTQKGIFAEFVVSNTAILNSNFTNYVEVTNIGGEANLINNTDNYTGTIVGSFDPNQKSVYPKGVGINGVISFADTLLKYKVQFQNTGSYQAFIVKVIDTIDAALDVSTFQFLSSSHPCTISFLATNVLLFTFNDIMLPDSTTNEQLSHGYVNYSIKTKLGLPLLTQIKNKASIYFDFNEPVITNETINTIDVVGVKENQDLTMLNLFPNPATDKLKIVTRIGIRKLNVTIYDLQGRLIQSEILPFENGIGTLSLQNFQKGFYLLKAENGEFTGTRSFIKE